MNLCPKIAPVVSRESNSTFLAVALNYASRVQEGIPMTPIYRWSGQYFGFLKNGNLFSNTSNYLGWVTEDGRVWKSNGQFLGEIVDEHYILRRTSMATPATRARKATPARPATPARRASRAGRASRASMVDALSELEFA